MHGLWMCLGTLFAALLWTLSCGPSPSATHTAVPALTPTATSEPTPTPSPLQVIRNSSARMIALDTASFTLEHEDGGSSELLPGLELFVARGEVDMPDRFKIKAETMSLFPRSFFEINIVVVGDQAFITDPVTERRIPAPIETLSFNFADLGRTLSDIILSMGNPTAAGTEKVDGVPSWRIEGTLPSESLRKL